MNGRLEAGITGEFPLRVTESKTVPALYPESPEFGEMPHVFATGYMVGLMEWACIEAVNPDIDWPREQTVGTHIDASHGAATPTGLRVTAKVKLIEVDEKRLVFEVEADDGIDLISQGTHERYVINKHRFEEKVLRKRP
ncbi:MAG: thioesterase family protein [bacterium]|nr:thioesterase family protein [bacterium]